MRWVAGRTEALENETPPFIQIRNTARAEEATSKVKCLRFLLYSLVPNFGMAFPIPFTGEHERTGPAHSLSFK
jgi:hypothetical protein